MTSLLHDPAQPVPFQPRDGGPTYLLRVPTVLDRARFKHAVVKAGARRWGQLDIVASARAAVNRLLAGDDNAADREARLADLNTYAAGIEAAIEVRRAGGGDADLIAALQVPPAVEQIMEIVAEVDEAVSERLADNLVSNEIAGYVAAKMFLAGWDKPGPFKRDPLSGATEPTLAQIEQGDLIAIGNRIGELLEPTADTMGNSGSASSGSPTPKRSGGTKTPHPIAPSPAETAGTSDGS